MMSLHCETCSKFFTYKQAYDRHVLTHDLEKITSFSQSFYNMYQPKSEPDGKPFDTATKQVYDMAQKSSDVAGLRPADKLPPHKAEIAPHKMEMVPYKTENLEQTTTNDSVSSQMSASNARPYRGSKLLKIYGCDQCSKSYTRKDHLERHKLYHTGDRPHVCSICFKSFVRKDKLQRHERTHIKEVKFNCEVCNKGFMRKDGLKKHMRIHPEPSEVEVLRTHSEASSAEMLRLHAEASNVGTSRNLGGNHMMAL